MSRGGLAVAAAAALTVAGCGGDPVPPAGTGAREAAQRFFAALAADDPAAAYDLLAAESRGRTGPAEFARLVHAYHRHLGFEANAVSVTACEEHGAEAVAHVTLTGKGPHRHRFKDGVGLRLEAAGWAVVPAANFGRPPKG